MILSRLRIVSFLAPNQIPMQEQVTQFLTNRLGCDYDFRAGASYDEAAEADLSFICGLPYVLRSVALEAVAAPVLVGERFGGKPMYFSDVIVQSDSACQSFADLRGHIMSWSRSRVMALRAGVWCRWARRRAFSAA